MAETLELWPEQDPVIDAVRAAFDEGHTRVLMQAPTGFGKTTCFTYIAWHAALKGNTVHIIVHRDELVTQVSERFMKYGISHGFIVADYPESPWEKIQICSVQTYNSRIKKKTVKPADLYVIDEAHHSSASTYVALWEFAPDAHFLGVTATPKRTDGHGLDFYEIEDPETKVITRKPLFTKLVAGPSVRSLIDAGRLVEPWHFAPEIPLDTSHLHVRYGEYIPKEVLELIKNSKIHGDAIRNHKQYCDGENGVAFCVNLEHCRMVAQEFNDAGIPAAVIDGTMSKTQRRRLVKRYLKKEILVLCSAQLITEGFDLPAIAAVHLMKISKSLIYYIQAVGRGLRADPENGKEGCYVFDYVGFIDKPGFGLVDSPRTWSLEGTIICDEAEPITQCGNCRRWNRGAVHFCDNCGEPMKKQKEDDDEKKAKVGSGSLFAQANANYSANKEVEMKRFESEYQRAKAKEDQAKAAKQRKLEEKDAARASNPYEAFVALGKQRNYKNPTFWASQMVAMRDRSNYLTNFKNRGKK